MSGHFQLQQGDIHLPLKFKAWISPRGEEAPNYVSYTMVHFGAVCLSRLSCVCKRRRGLLDLWGYRSVLYVVV